MSLTEFVKEPSIRERLDTEFPNQGTRASKPVAADWQTNNYALVGTAFDYLLRFWLRKHVENVSTRSWIAEDGLNVAKELYPEYTDGIHETINRVETLRDDFLETGELTRPLIEGALDLARIDSIYRGGVEPTNLGEYSDADIVDCIKLMGLLNEMDEFRTASHAVLNPTFGLASAFVGGADADAIIDGTLVDVKATRKATFKVDYWRQLVGYLVLADIHQTLAESGIYDRLGYDDDLDAQDLPDIDEFGVYYARHGELSTVPASHIYEDDSYPEFRAWFVEAALDMYVPVDDPVADAIRKLF